MAQKKNGLDASKVITGLVGLTAAAVGTYYLYGHKNAAKNRSKIKGWMLKAKGEVLEHLEEMGDISEPLYMSAVDSVLQKYNALKTIDPTELASFAHEMKDHWLGIKKTTKKVSSKKKTKK